MVREKIVVGIVNKMKDWSKVSDDQFLEFFEEIIEILFQGEIEFLLGKISQFRPEAFKKYIDKHNA